MAKKEIIKIIFEYSLKTINKTENPCRECVFSVGNSMCFGKELCKYTDDNPVVYYFESLKEQSEETESKKDDIHFSYRDENSEAQHGKIKKQDAGEYIGELKTYKSKVIQLFKEFRLIDH